MWIRSVSWDGKENMRTTKALFGSHAVYSLVLGDFFYVRRMFEWQGKLVKPDLLPEAELLSS